jgi:O-antigen/teichoic acid export membrane protein
MLAPEDFGAVALVTAMLTVLDGVAQLGTPVALVQRSEVTGDVVDSAFVLSVSTSLVGAGILAVSGPLLAQFFAVPVLASLARVGALTFFCQGLASFVQSLMMRGMAFRKVASIQVSSALVYGMVAIAMAWVGYRAESVVWGGAAGAAASLLLSFALHPFRPRSFGSLAGMKSLLQFGLWISLGRALGLIAAQSDRFIIGRVLTESALGGYYYAQRLAMGFPNIVAASADQALLPIYSGSGNDSETIARGYWKGLKVNAMLVLPLTMLLAVHAGPVVWLLLGDPWMDIVPIVRVLSVVGAIQSTGGGVYSSAVYASGKPYINSMANTFRVIGLPPAVWFGSQWGIMGVVWALAGFAVVGRLFNQWLLSRFLGYSLTRYFGSLVRPGVAAGAIVVVALATGTWIELDGFGTVLILTSVSAAAALAAYVAVSVGLLPEESRMIGDHLRRFCRRSPTV